MAALVTADMLLLNMGRSVENLKVVYLDDTSSITKEL
jgi:hypothetical protein